MNGDPRIAPRRLAIALPALLAGAGLALTLLWPEWRARMALPPGSALDRLGEPAANVLFWAAAAWLTVRLVDGLVFLRLMPARTGQSTPRLLRELMAAGVWAFALSAIVLSLFEGVLTGLLAASSILVAVVGFALRNTLADIFAGLTLSLDRPYRLGDWIELDPNTAGRVVEVTWRTTRLLTIDRIGIVLPNALAASTVLRNYSTPEPYWRDRIDVSLDNGVPPAQAERILLAAAVAVPEVNALPRQPEVRVIDFSPRGIVYQLRFWVPDYESRWRLHDEVRRNILQQLHQAGIAVTGPRLDLFHAPMPARDIDRRRHLDTLIGRVPLFQPLDAAELAALAGTAGVRSFAAGEAVVRQGEPGASLFVVLEGLLHVSEATENGSSRRFGQLRPGEIFGELSLLTGEPRSATVTTSTASELLEITKETFSPILERRQELAQKLGEIVAQRAAQRAAFGVRLPDLPDLTLANQAQVLRRIRLFFGLRQP